MEKNLQNRVLSQRYPGWCSFCSKSYRDVGPLVEGLDQDYICLQCLRSTARLFQMELHDRAGLPKQEMNKVGGSGQSQDCFCSFCRTSFREVGPLVEGRDQVYICRRCAELSGRIIEAEYARLGIEMPKPLES